MQPEPHEAVVRHCAPEANLTLTAAERRRVESALAHARHRREEVFCRYLTSLLHVRSPHYTNVY